MVRETLANQITSQKGHLFLMVLVLACLPEMKSRVPQEILLVDQTRKEFLQKEIISMLTFNLECFIIMYFCCLNHILSAG